MTAFYRVPESVNEFWREFSCRSGTYEMRQRIREEHPMARKCFQCGKTFLPTVMMIFYTDSGRILHRDGGPLELFGNSWNDIVAPFDRHIQGHSVSQHQFVKGLWLDGTVEVNGGSMCSRGCYTDFAREQYD